VRRRDPYREANIAARKRRSFARLSYSFTAGVFPVTSSMGGKSSATERGGRSSAATMPTEISWSAENSETAGWAEGSGAPFWSTATQTASPHWVLYGEGARLPVKFRSPPVIDDGSKNRR
jgi:hypothetical protein